MASEQTSGIGYSGRNGRPNLSEPIRGVTRYPTKREVELRKYSEGRLIGLRVNRYSWWVHWRELADYILPRRYKWLVTPNQMARGSPINQHILDNTGTLAARDLAAGLMTGCTDPTKRWYRLKVNGVDSTQTSPVSLWLSACEQMLDTIFQESNFYTALATWYLDLVIFGTATMIIYEDFDNVINCINPCLGEYYVEIDNKYFPSILYREFTMTVSQVVEEFGLANVTPSIARLYKQGGTSLTRELVVAHGIEPNQPSRTGIPARFKFYECYWEWSGTEGPQGGAGYEQGFLRCRGFHDQPQVTARWDTVSNDAYGRSPGMDALPDIRQLQLETKRKAQGIDKQVNPPLVADVQLKNQPASLLPGGITYIAGMVANGGRPGMAPVYTVQPELEAMTADLDRIKEMIKETFYNNLFRVISQYETRSNVTAVEIDQRRSEAMVMLGPALNNVNFEGLRVAVSRTFDIAKRAGILPPPPQEIQGMEIIIDFVSMLEQAQDAAQGAGIERILQLGGNLAGVDPSAMDNIDIDYALEKLSSLLGNDPKLIRSQDQLQAIRQQRQQDAQQQKMAAGADTAQKLAQGAQTLSQTDVGGGQNALQLMTGAA